MAKSRAKSTAPANTGQAALPVPSGSALFGAASTPRTTEACTDLALRRGEACLRPEPCARPEAEGEDKLRPYTDDRPSGIASRPGKGDAAREEKLASLIQELERRFGPGVVYRLSQAVPKVGETAVSTGSLGLDLATGLGGIPRGRISEIMGADSSGKTSLAYHVIANAQRDRGLAAFVDGEGSADADAMQRLGVDLSDLVLASPASSKEALEMADVLVRSQALDALVVSTAHALSSLSEALRKINAFLKGSPTAVVFLNQGMPRAGGYALAFYSSLRLELTFVRPLLRPWGDAVGVRVRAQVRKNKLAAPLRAVEFDLRQDRGIHREAELVELGLQRGLVAQHDLGFIYAGQALGLGLLRAATYLEQNPELAARLEKELREGKDGKDGRDGR